MRIQDGQCFFGMLPCQIVERGGKEPRMPRQVMFDVTAIPFGRRGDLRRDLPSSDYDATREKAR